MDDATVPGVELRDLFEACDTSRRGFIGRDEFAELCASFQIGRDDADVIFADLDRDRDQRISLEDFTHGFREFLGTSRRQDREITHDDSKQKRKLLLKKQASIQAWRHLSERIGKDAIGRFLSQSADELYVLYAELHDTEAPPRLVMQFEHLMESLSTDARQLEQERAEMHEALRREREQHRAHLKSLEDEIDAQVQRVALVVRQDAETKFETEKREIQTKLEAEIVQLQTHLRLFQKVEHWLQKEQHTQGEASREHLEAAKKATEENRQLKMSLAEAQTTLTLLQTELAQLKSEYIAKDHFLNSEKETVFDLVSHQERVVRQLELLQDANRQLQDTNDSLRACITDIATPRRSPIGSICCTPRPASQRPSPRLGAHDPAATTMADALGLTPQFGYSPTGRASSIRQELDAVSSSSTSSPSPSPSASFVINRPDLGLVDPTIVKSDWDPVGPTDRTFKVVFAGDAAVGKSSFIKRVCDGIFVGHTITTLGVDYRVKTIRVDGRNVAIQLWDTAGQERFRSIAQSYFRKADGVLLAFDVSNERSFLNVRSWCDSVNEALDTVKTSPSSAAAAAAAVDVGPFPIVLCATKADLRRDAEHKGVPSGIVCVQSGDAERLAAQIGSHYIETSAKTGHNTLEALVLLARQMMIRQDSEVQVSALRLTDDKRLRRRQCCTSS